MVGPDATIKFLYSYAGKIAPRQTDGKLRYVGGHTRVLAVHRSIPFSELLLKLGELCGTTVNVRCQLPTEDLDALVSVTCDEDLANVIEEYDRLSSPTSKIRAFLSPPKPLQNSNTSSTAPFSSVSSKSSSSSSSSVSSGTSTAASCGSCCSPRCKLLSPVRHPAGLEKSKGRIEQREPVPHPLRCYRGQHQGNGAHYYLIHNGNRWE